MKAAAFSEQLSLLNVTKINTCLRRGILGCMSLLLVLEKVFGADRIEKLIKCNWAVAGANFKLFKVLFSHRTDANGLLPRE